MNQIKRKILAATLFLAFGLQANAAVIVQNYDFSLDALTYSKLYEESSDFRLPASASLTFGLNSQDKEWFYNPFDSSLGQLNSVKVELISAYLFTHRYATIGSGSAIVGTYSTPSTATNPSLALTARQTFRLAGYGVNSSDTSRAEDRQCFSFAAPLCPDSDSVSGLFSVSTTLISGDAGFEKYLDIFSDPTDSLLLRNTANTGGVECRLVGSSSCFSGFVNGFNHGWRGSIALTYDYTERSVPEPSVLTLLVAGFAGLGLIRRRKQKA